MLLIGPSGSGKSRLVERMIREHRLIFSNPLTRVYVFYMHDQPIYDQIREGELEVEMHHGLPPSDFEPVANSLIVFDDLQYEKDKENVLASWFHRRSHHSSTSICMCQQNHMAKVGGGREISLNATHFILFQNKQDISQIARLNYRWTGGGPARGFLQSVFKRVCRDKPFSFLIADLDTTTPDLFRFRDSLVPEEGGAVYVPPT